ncbi:MAG: LysR family transcriptional regulator [Devosia sp.]
MKTLDPLAGVSVFIAVSETLNFGTAAERLGMSRATVSAQVGELERRLGVRLFQRSTRAVRLTEAGHAYRQALGGVADQAQEAALVAQGHQQALSGRIRLTAPDELYQRYVVPAMVEFAAEQPEVSFDIEQTSRRADIIREGFDLALRASLTVAPTMIVRRLGTSPVSLTAAPGYLARRGVPASPDELAQHDIAHHSGLGAGALWVMRRDGEERRVPVRPRIWLNDGGALRDAAVAGLGITYLPEFITGPMLRAGGLVRVLPEWQIATVDVNAVYPSNRNITPKVRGFVAVLAKCFEGDPDFA